MLVLPPGSIDYAGVVERRFCFVRGFEANLLKPPPRLSGEVKNKYLKTKVQAKSDKPYLRFPTGVVSPDGSFVGAEKLYEHIQAVLKMNPTEDDRREYAKQLTAWRKYMKEVKAARKLAKKASAKRAADRKRAEKAAAEKVARKAADEKAPVKKVAASKPVTGGHGLGSFRRAK